MSKMKQCKVCGAEVAKSAKACPGCGAKLRKGHKLLIVIVVMLVIVAIAASSGGGDDKSKPAADVTQGGGAENKKEISMEERVLVDKNGIKITAKSLDMDNLLGPELKLLIENNSGKDLTVQVRNVSVNGYMVAPMMSVDIANGKKANDSITFLKSSLEICQIKDIADIELAFHIFTTEAWETYLDTELIQITTSIANTYQYTYDDSGKLAYEGNGIRIVVKQLDDDSILGKEIVLYIENNSDKAVTVQVREVSANGFMIDSVFSCEIIPGKKAVDSITLLNSSLEENGITMISDVELSFHIFESDSWDTIVDTEAVKITF